MLIINNKLFHNYFLLWLEKRGKSVFFIDKQVYLTHSKQFTSYSGYLILLTVKLFQVKKLIDNTGEGCLDYKHLLYENYYN